MASHSTAAVLHVFDRACNLVGESGCVLSLVSSDLGPGPFSILLPISTPFSQLTSAGARVLVRDPILELGPLTVDTSCASFWRATPDWHQAKARREAILGFLPTISGVLAEWRERISDGLGSMLGQRFSVACDQLHRGLRMRDVSLCTTGAEMLAGLGYGLTPAGDDYLVGAIHAIWASLAHDEAQALAKALAEAAVSRTTTLSAAWLAAAARGEANQPWHDLMDSIGLDMRAAARSLERILSFGDSSGAAALSGFAAAYQHLHTDSRVR